jgi:hypothetical protein
MCLGHFGEKKETTGGVAYVEKQKPLAGIETDKKKKATKLLAK